MPMNYKQDGNASSYGLDMDNIKLLLDLEDSDICITDIYEDGTQKFIVIETAPHVHFCPLCNYRMYSKGIKERTINHPILQDMYALTLILKQRRWKCTNPDCRYDIAEAFHFVDRNRRTTNATDMMIVLEYRNLNICTTAIADKYNVSDTYVHNVFNRYLYR